VGGYASINDNILVGGDASFNDNVHVAGNLNVEGELTQNGRTVQF